MNFRIQRGTNISHWLSQSVRRGPERRAFFTESDVRRIAEWGFDHFRLPIDEEQMWDKAGRPDAEAFGLMDDALDWAGRAGLSVVVDLHILRSHYFGDKTTPALFTDPAEGRRFADLWRQLSVHLERRPADRVAFELMNEPVAPSPADWNRVAALAFEAIRRREPERTIVLGSNRWNSVDTFDALSVPDDRHTILSFHYYEPMLVTHYRAPWWLDSALYDGPVQYPGAPIPAERLAAIAEPARSKLAALNAPHDRAVMAAAMAKPLGQARKTGLPLYCGEFGVFEKTPPAPRLAWYRDVISVFREYGIAWANWDYKGGFALVKDGKSTGIAEAMLAP